MFDLEQESSLPSTVKVYSWYTSQEHQPTSLEEMTA